MKVTSEAGFLAFRELDEAFRLTEQGSAVLSDPRQGKNTQHAMLGARNDKLHKLMADLKMCRESLAL
ncbi:MAG: hypothetical protein IH899_07905 [Planctomycetes bacterium]|nr:hypothetical protein [Planctomycetota bacterium]